MEKLPIVEEILSLIVEITGDCEQVHLETLKLNEVAESGKAEIENLKKQLEIVNCRLSEEGKIVKIQIDEIEALKEIIALQGKNQSEEVHSYHSNVVLQQQLCECKYEVAKNTVISTKFRYLQFFLLG
jgi:TolA-binding protein